MEVTETDPLTHGLIGASLAALSGHPLQLNDPVFLGCTLGAMLPDLDIVTHYKGRLNYLLKHRGASHSLLALSGMALGLSALLYVVFPTTAWSSIFFWTLVGVFSHGLFDVLNSYGAKLFWPFIDKRITINMAMLTEPVIFTVFLSSAIFTWSIPSLATQSTVAAFALSSLYLAYREYSRAKVRKRLINVYHLKDKSQVRVLPAMYRPFNWNFLLIQKKSVRFGTVRKNTPTIEQVLPRWDESDPYVAAAKDGMVAGIFDEFTPYYHILTKQDEDEFKIEFLDLRYWTKGNFLYSGKVVMDCHGQIASESFHHVPNKEGILLSY